MKDLMFLGRCFYGIGIAGIGVQQFIYSTFRPMLLPYWPVSMPAVSIGAYIIGALLIVAGAMIIFSKRARLVSIVLAIFFFVLFLCAHIYYQLFINTYGFHLGLWTDALKELAVSGGELIMAATLPKANAVLSDKLLRVLGRIFFSIMLIAFGIDHFLYTAFVATLVPGWLPWHTFWTYVGAAGLIGAGVCILLKIKISQVSILAGIMLLLWFIILHIPRAVADPNTGQGNEITNVFQALAFSGIAFAIAGLYNSRVADKEAKLEKGFNPKSGTTLNFI